MKVVWSRRAIANLTSLREFIKRDSFGSAARIASLILESVDLLTVQSHMGRPGRVVGTRELVVPGTSYVIPYRVQDGRLELLAVFHGRQK